MLFLFRLKYHFYTALKPGEGPRALRFALWPFPGAPSHSTPNAFYMCKCLTAFDLYWAASRYGRCELGVLSDKLFDLRNYGDFISYALSLRSFLFLRYSVKDRAPICLRLFNMACQIVFPSASVISPLS